MIKGKHDFFTNQFLTFVVAIELQSIKLKMYCATWYHNSLQNHY